LVTFEILAGLKRNFYVYLPMKFRYFIIFCLVFCSVLFGFNVAVCVTVTISDRVTMSLHKYRRVVLGPQGIFTVSDLGVYILCPVYCGCWESFPM